MVCGLLVLTVTALMAGSNGGEEAGDEGQDNYGDFTNTDPSNTGHSTSSQGISDYAYRHRYFSDVSRQSYHLPDSVIGSTMRTTVWRNQMASRIISNDD